MWCPGSQIERIFVLRNCREKGFRPVAVLEQLPEHVDYGRLDETGMRVVDWLNGMADPSPEIFEDWEAISLIRQNVYEDEPTGLADLLRSATRTERDECFDMLEQVETGRPL